MFEGQLLGIAISPTKGVTLQSVPEVEALAGRGLRGDRYIDQRGGDGVPITTRQVTLIESETLAALKRDYDIELDHPSTRRNLLTKGTPLNQLVGETFLIGEVRIRGLELCEPCGHLENLTKAGVKRALIHRGGLRGEILNDGVLRVGDVIRLG